MRDGTRIAAEAYLPAGVPAGERLPTILVQTRYYRAAEFRWPASRTNDGVTFPLLPGFIRRGYAVVITDVRGTGASFGAREAEWAPEEVRDGAEVVDWIIRQPWSNGMVGATGLSYPGTTSELLLLNHHPAVKAAAPLFAPWDLYADLAFPGGALLDGPTRSWSDLIRLLDRNEVARREGWRARLAFRGVRPVDGRDGRRLLRQAVRGRGDNFAVYPEIARLVFRDDTISTGWSFDGVSPHAFVDGVNASGAAVYSYSGWFDGALQNAAVKRHLALANPANRLLLGPWNHGLSQNASPHSPSSRTAFLHAQELIRFFDYHLKGIDHGFSREKPVHYFTMGEERWKAADRWPVPEARMHSLYLNAGQRLTSTPPGMEEGYDTIPADMQVGTGTTSRWNSLVGGRRVRYEDRGDLTGRVLSYTTDPLEVDTEVTGHPVVTLFVRSDASDGLFFVYLEEVDAEEHVVYVTEGVLRALHRRLSTPPDWYPAGLPYRTFNRADAAPLVPGEVAELTFDLLPTSFLFRKGNRIRISVTQADRDHFVTPVGAAPVAELLRSGAFAPRVEVPVVPRP